MAMLIFKAKWKKEINKMDKIIKKVNIEINKKKNDFLLLLIRLVLLKLIKFISSSLILNNYWIIIISVIEQLN